MPGDEGCSGEVRWVDEWWMWIILWEGEGSKVR